MHFPVFLSNHLAICFMQMAAFTSYKLIRINVEQMALEQNTAIGLKGKASNAIIPTIDGISFHGLSIIVLLVCL
jgi:hypothetical protein